MQPVLLNSNRSDSQQPDRDNSPTKDGQTEPAASGAGHSREHDSFSRGQSQCDNISAIATACEMLDHASALYAGESLLGEGGEEVSVGMKLCPCWGRCLQLLAHDFWNVLHW
jgi:hypothetical protein